MQWLKNYRLWIGVGFVGLLIVLRFSGLGDYITLDMVQQKRVTLMTLVNKHYIISVLAYIAFYSVIVALALPIAALSTVMGGFLFGVFPATFYANIGATGGAIIFFLVVRYSFGTTLQKRYKNQLHWFNVQMEKYGVSYLIAIHFIAVIPFFVVNLLIGLTKIPLWTFIWTTSIGILPGSLVYAFAGKQLTTITSIRDIFSFNILIAFALLALLAMVPILVQRYRLWA